MPGRRGSSWSRVLFLLSLIFIGLGGTPVIPAAESLRPVDLELILAIDCSYSVDTTEFDLQKIGLAQAFRNPAVLGAIQAGQYKSIAVTVVEWSGPKSQIIAVPWTRVHDAASALTMAARIEAAPRLTAEGATSISSMIEFGLASFHVNRFAASRRVIDISADGRNNSGRKIRALAPLILEQGVTVNGLALLNEVRTLNFYFEKYVIAGPGAFVIQADDYENYAIAILRKLLQEISDPPMS